MACDTVCFGGCFDPGTYYIVISATGGPGSVSCGNGDYTVSLDCQPCRPCPQCDAAMMQEGEPCPNYPDTYNNGCAADGTVNVLPVPCNQDICGTLWQTPNGMDRDVYQVRLLQPDSLVWTVVANVAPALQIIEPLPGCAGNIVRAQTYGNRCDTVRLGVCLPPGIYWLVVTSAQTITVPCESYTASVRCYPCQPLCAICPPGARPEGEPCPSYQFDYNGGCTTNPPQATPIACGDTICGYTNYYDLPDYDFYQFTLTQRDTVRWCVEALFDVFAAIYTPDPSCPNMIVHASGSAPACTTLCIAACLPPGTYWALVRASTSFGGPACQPYVASLYCAPCPTGDVCNYADLDFDPANDACSTTNLVLACGDTLCGEIVAQGERDWYTFNIPFGTPCVRLQVDVYGNDTPGFFPFGQGLNSAAALYAADCATQLAFDNDSGIGTDALLTSTCLPPGTYHLQVGGAQGTMGPYILALGCTPCPCPPPCGYPDQDLEPNDACDPASNPVLACPDTVCGAIRNAGALDQDWYMIQIPAPGCRSLTINVYGNDTPGYFPYLAGLDPLAALYDGSCTNQLALDDNSGTGNDAQLSSACLQPGTYFLQVSGVGGSQGPYVLAVSCADCPCQPVCTYPNMDFDPTNDLCGQTTVMLSCADTVCGDIVPDAAGLGDADWYSLQLSGHHCTQVQIAVYGNDTPGWYPAGGGLDPTVWLYAADCTTLLAFDWDSGVGEDSELISGCLPPGLYRIKVEGAGGTMGPYVLGILCAGCECPCNIDCPSGFPQEGEACPNLGPDTYNGGCSVTPPAFVDISCGPPYNRFCGTSFAMGGIRDEDWFRFTLTAPRRILWAVTAEFPFEMGIYAPITGCDSLRTIRYAEGGPCQTRVLFVKCLPAGTYFFYIAPSVTTGVACSDYISRLMCGKCIVHPVVIKILDRVVRLDWEADETVPVYNVHRGTTPNFEPGPDTYIGSTSENMFLDEEALTSGPGRAFYVVTMQDPPADEGMAP